MKQYTLVKYNYDALPEEWKKKNLNHFEGLTFMYLGEVTNMKGHAYVQEILNGIPLILEIENLIELKPNEL